MKTQISVCEHFFKGFMDFLSSVRFLRYFLMHKAGHLNHKKKAYRPLEIVCDTDLNIA